MWQKAKFPTSLNLSVMWQQAKTPKLGTFKTGFFFFKDFFFAYLIESILKVSYLGKSTGKTRNKTLEKLKGKVFSRPKTKCEGKGVGDVFCLEYQDPLWLHQAQKFFTLIFMVLGARAVISFCMRSAIPGYMVVPPDKTLLAYRSLRISMSHFMMLL